MKTLLIALAFSSMMLCGCSDSFEDFIINDKTEEAWDGVGTPSWLNNKAFDISMERGWAWDNYLFPAMWKVYLFHYEEQVLVYMHYDCLRQHHFETGGYCYTTDGREVDFSKVNNKFDQTKALIYTNQMGGEGAIPQVQDMHITDWEKYQWMQQELKDICKEADEAGSFITRIRIAISKDEEQEQHIGIAYDYCPYDFAETHVERYYSLSGTPVEMPENSISNNLIEYTDLWYRQLGFLDIR